jgi:hypothetical protein
MVSCADYWKTVQSPTIEGTESQSIAAVVVAQNGAREPLSLADLWSKVVA